MQAGTGPLGNRAVSSLCPPSAHESAHGLGLAGMLASCLLFWVYWKDQISTGEGRGDLYVQSLPVKRFPSPKATTGALDRHHELVK